MQEIAQLSSLYPSSTVIGAIIVGCILGSFLNVVIYRLPKMMEAEWREQCTELLCAESSENSIPPNLEHVKSEPFNLVVPRSRCPHCGHHIAAWENVPVISYLFQIGRAHV